MSKIDIQKKKLKQIDEYVKIHFINSASETIKYNREKLKRFGKYLGKKPFEEATPEDTTSFITKYSQSGYNSIKSCLTNFYRWLNNLDEDDRLPDCVRILKSRKNRTIRKQGKEIVNRERLISPEEYQLLLNNAINPYQKAIIEALWLIGPRISELLSMKATDIIETEKLTKIILRESKTKPREVPIQETPVYLLEWYRTYQPYKGDNTKPLWASPYGKDTFQTIKREAVLKMIQKTAKKAGIQKKITLHDFRHTAISRDLKNGLPTTLVETKYGLIHGSDQIQIYDHNGNVQLEEYYTNRPIDTPVTRYALERKLKENTEEDEVKLKKLEDQVMFLTTKSEDIEVNLNASMLVTMFTINGLHIQGIRKVDKDGKEVIDEYSILNKKNFDKQRKESISKFLEIAQQQTDEKTINAFKSQLHELGISL